MQQPAKFNGDAVAAAADAKKQKRIQRLDKLIAYYGSIKHVVALILGTVFGIVELRYGLQYNGQCPTQPMIAYFLIVHGAVMLFEVLIGILAFLNSRVIYKKHNQVVARRLVFILLLILVVVNVFCFAWFIAGNIWVFGAISNGNQSTSTNLNTYCQADLFRTALGIIISRYVLFGIILIVVVIAKHRAILRCCKKEEASSINGALST